MAEPKHQFLLIAGGALVGTAAGFALGTWLAGAQRRAPELAGTQRRAPTGIAGHSNELPLLVPSQQLDPACLDAPGADLRLVRKAEAVLSRRVGPLLVVLECLQDGHNHCAVLRTMEALGVQHIWLVSPPSMEPKNLAKRKELAALAESSKRGRVKRYAQQRVDAAWTAESQLDEQHVAFAQGAQRWLTVREFETSAECIQALSAEGWTLWATALEQRAEVLAPGAPWLQEAGALPPRLAVVFGAEGAGVSEVFKAAASRLVYLPLNGFAESLNVSVAAALVVQLLLQLLGGQRPAEELQLTAQEQRALRGDWYTKLARSEDELEEYMALLDQPPTPFDDLRRPDTHRRGRKK